MKRSFAKKVLLTTILAWGFAHVIFLVIGIGQRDGHLFKYSKIDYDSFPEEYINYNVVDDFYPFNDTSLLDYDISEFLIYAGIPLFVYFIWIYVFRKEPVK
ncbi:MAG: hypothetical protein KA793_08680 [Bacteroidales bacterium]|nr:hypothetical protein [Bacteroidales bacterium]